MKIKEFHIEDDIRNKGHKLLIAISEDGLKYVVAGNPHFPTSIIPYNECWYVDIPENK